MSEQKRRRSRAVRGGTAAGEPDRSGGGSRLRVLLAVLTLVAIAAGLLYWGYAPGDSASSPSSDAQTQLSNEFRSGLLTDAATPNGIASGGSADSSAAGSDVDAVPKRPASSAVEPDAAETEVIDPQDTSPEAHQKLLKGMTAMARRVAHTFPNDPTSFDLLGRVYVYQGDSEDAKEAWEHCLALDARRPDACRGLGKLAIKRGDDAAAEPLLRTALEIDPAMPDVAGDLAEVLMRQGRPEEAVQVLQDYVKRVPKEVDSLIQLGQIQLQRQEYDQAQANFEAALKQRPNSSEAYLGLGTALIRKGQREQAQQYLEKSRALRAAKPHTVPGMSAEVFDITMTRVNYGGAALYAAKLYQRHGQVNEAASLAHRAADIDPKNLPARLFLMSLYEHTSRLPQAIEVCRATVAADPQNPDLLWRLGVLCRQSAPF